MKYLENQYETVTLYDAQEEYESDTLFFRKRGTNMDAVRKHGVLHYAARQGWVEIVGSLLESITNVDVLNSNGLTALHCAAREGHGEVVKFLLGKGADVNAVNKRCETALHYAISMRHVDVVLSLLEHGAKVGLEDADGKTPLHFVATSDLFEVLEPFLECGANIDAKDHCGRTPLHDVAIGGRVQVLTSLLEHGANVHVRDHRGRTPLHDGAASGLVEVVALLLEYGASVHASDNKGRTPLYDASNEWSPLEFEVAAYLLQHGSNASAMDKSGRTPLHETASCGCANIAQLLIEGGAKVDAIDNNGDTPLHLAALHCGELQYGDSMNGHLMVVRFLLRQEADACATNNKGETPLHNAACSNNVSGNIKLVAPLIMHGAKVNAVDNKNGYTALHDAIRIGNVDFIRALLNQVATTTESTESVLQVRDNSGCTALHLALNRTADMEVKNLDMVLALLEHGADVTTRDQYGRTPLHIVASTSHLHQSSEKLAAALLQHGSSVHEETTIDGFSVLELAILSVRESSISLNLCQTRILLGLVSILLAHGATIRDNCTACIIPDSTRTVIHQLAWNGFSTAAAKLYFVFALHPTDTMDK